MPGVTKRAGYFLWRQCLLMTTLAVTACSSSDSTDQQTKIAASASQTIVLVLDSWATGAVPSHYASATLQSTADMLAEASQQMQSGSSPETPERRGVITAVGRLSAAARRAQAGVVAGNPRQVRGALQELETAATDLAAARARDVAPKS